MPLWAILLLAAAGLTILGIVEVGKLALWISLTLLVAGLVVLIIGFVHPDRPPTARPRRWFRARAADQTSVGSQTPRSWRLRLARLGWISIGLAVLSLALLGFSVWAVAHEQPRILTDQAHRVELPVPVNLPAPRLATVLGLASGIAAILLAVAALQAATAIHVLSRGRRTGEPLPGRDAALARRILGPVATRALELERPPEWPASALPAGSDSAHASVRCTVLIPAHDEQAVLGRTLASLGRQTRVPERVIVVADNCTDDTVRIARTHDVEVFETVGNTRHKAGALNQALGPLLAQAGVEDVFVVMDADSTITPDFLAAAVECLRDDPELMAVGGLFSGEEGARLLGQMQRNEFSRYQRVIARREGQLFVLTGTASALRGYALRAVAQARGKLIPGVAGDVYDTLAMTEDNELTLALKSLGARLVSPPQCRVTTEVMPTWRDLWRQRSRWQRGAVENVAAYGITRATTRYWLQQLALGYAVIALNSYLLLVTIALLASGSTEWSPVWLTIGAIFVVERVVTAWSTGWRGRLVALALIPELGYALYLQACFVVALAKISSGDRAGWNYVPRQTLDAILVVPLAAVALLTSWHPLPSSVLESAWFEALSLFVGFNTLIFATRSLFEVLPPIRRSIHRIQQRRRARR